MSRYFNSLSRILEERETNGEVMATEPQIPQIQTISWTDKTVSPEWLKRMSAVFTINQRINLFDPAVIPTVRPKTLKLGKLNNCYLVSLNNVCDHSVFACEGCNTCNKRPRFKNTLATNSSVAEETQRRRPDSSYISLINGAPPGTSSDQLRTESSIDEDRVTERGHTSDEGLDEQD